MPNLDATIDTELGQLGAQRETLLGQQEAAGAERAQMHEAGVAREQEEMGRLTELEAQPVPARPTVEMPPPPDLKKLISSQDYEGLAQGLLAMALVGGVASKGDWLGVSATLNGALKGFHEGNQEKAKRELEDYQTKFKAAQEKTAAVNKQYEDILNNRKLTINEQREKIKLIATQNGHTDVYTAANMKSIDGMINQIDSRITQLAGVKQRHEDVQMRMDTQIKLHNLTAGVPMSKNAMWFAEQLAAGGDYTILSKLSSRYGRQVMGPVLEDLANEAIRTGTDPREMASAHATQIAETAALRVATNRKNAVERLTTSVQTLEQRAVDLTQRLNGMGIKGANATINAVRNQWGDAELSELKTLAGGIGRQYVEAITMPGSNAQMHVTAQEWASGLINEDLPLSSLLGTLKGMNTEINATKGALEKQITEGNQRIRGAGYTIPRPDAPAAAAPYSDPEKERRYQEWKRTHGGQ